MRLPGFFVASFVFLSCVNATAPPVGPIQIPFRWTPGQIEVQASFNGRSPIWCIVDSGSDFSMIDIETAKSLKLGSVYRQQEKINHVTLRINSLILPLHSITLWPLDNFRRQKREIRGLIGCELFERYVVTLDFQRKLIMVQEPATFHPNASARQLPISFTGHLPVIEAKITFDGKEVPVKLMVDTGASQIVTLRYPFAAKHGLFDTADKSVKSETVATGQRGFVPLHIQELAFSRSKWKNPYVEAYGTSTGAGGDTETDGLLGNEVLRQFRVTFDYSRKRLILEDY
jgi:predicted aspartyl protease